MESPMSCSDKPNPSGKLPVGFPKQFSDSPAFGNYPGKDLVVTYAEGIWPVRLFRTDAIGK